MGPAPDASATPPNPPTSPTPPNPPNPPDLDLVLRLDDLEAIARARLPKPVYDYYASGAADELTLRRNRAAFEELSIAYRVLVDVSQRDPSTTVLGRPVAMPVLIAPTAFHRLAHPDGELATARAARAAGTTMILSTLSNTRLEEVAPLADVWFQLYVYKDRQATEALIARAEAAGCAALVLTVDAPLIGSREADRRNQFQLRPGLAVENLVPEGYGAIAPPPPSDSGLAAYFAGLIDASLSWRDLEWLRKTTRLPLLVKGIVRPDDARRARDAGAQGIVVSNHGGRQLDTAPATIRVLPEIAEALAGSGVEILLDGGVRRGTDVLKALALGARAVLVGRPILWGLAAAGEAGVTKALAILRQELDLGMALAGAPNLAAISRDLVLPR
jgi:4-hydroxymandelate oxidase